MEILHTVPCIVGDAPSLHIKVDTGLENGRGTRITIDTDPGGRRVGLGRAAAGGDLWGRHGESAGDGGVARTNEDGTSPLERKIVSLIGHGEIYGQ